MQYCRALTIEKEAVQDQEPKRRPGPASFLEVQIFDQVAEPTGVTVDRDAVRGRKTVCRSLSELESKGRRMGDGFYYLAADAWPAEVVKIDLHKVWQTMS